MGIHISIAAIILALVTGLAFYAHVIENNSIVDIFWGFGFCIIAISALVLSGNYSVRPILATALVLLWGLRLSIYIGRRNAGKGEDFRYVAMRQRWGKQQVLGAYLQVFLLQGALMFIISLPVQNINLYSSSSMNLLDAAGVLLWITGFYFEAVGDYQLKRFKAVETNKGKIMTTGLWSLTRHPNYFGEILLWWGIFLVALNAPYWYLSLAGTAVITYLLMKVSGVPMLEAKYKDNPDYQEYVKHTPALFPRLFK